MPRRSCLLSCFLSGIFFFLLGLDIKETSQCSLIISVATFPNQVDDYLINVLFISFTSLPFLSQSVCPSVHH